MYFFRVSLENSLQNNKEIILSLNKQLSKSHFEAILFKTIEDAIEDRIKDFGNIPNTTTLNCLWSNVINKLKDKGFKEVKYEDEEVFNGDVNLFSKHTTILNKKLTTLLLRKGYK